MFIGRNIRQNNASSKNFATNVLAVEKTLFEFSNQVVINKFATKNLWSLICGIYRRSSHRWRKHV